jgi:hypothetical protein
MMGQFLHHSDQVGFCLAVLELQAPLSHLPCGMNFPTHLPLHMYHDAAHSTSPSVVHYHSNIDSTGKPLPIGISSVDSAIARGVQALRYTELTRFRGETFLDLVNRMERQNYVTAG